MIFNGLVQLDKNLNIQPCLAKSWNISDDGLTYTFNLRADVSFHDNELFKNAADRILVAEDVAYSLNRIIDPKTASPGSWIFNDRVDPDQPFAAINDSTFQIKLLRPFGPLLSILTMQYAFIIPQKVAKHYGKDFRVHPAGTGPFQFKAWQEGDVLVTVKNEIHEKKYLLYSNFKARLGYKKIFTLVRN